MGKGRALQHPHRQEAAYLVATAFHTSPVGPYPLLAHIVTISEKRLPLPFGILSLCPLKYLPVPGTEAVPPASLPPLLLGFLSLLRESILPRVWGQGLSPQGMLS